MTTQPPDPNEGEPREGGGSQPAPPPPSSGGDQPAPPPPPPSSGGYQPAPPPPPGEYGAPQQGYGAPQPGYGAPQPGYGAPGQGQPYGMVPQTESKATIALVLAIVGFFTCPLILGIIALVLANQADQSIRASGGYKTGESQVRWARIVAWIDIVLSVIGLAIWIIAIAASA